MLLTINHMKRLILFLLLTMVVIFPNAKAFAFPVAFEPLKIQEKNINKSNGAVKKEKALTEKLSVKQKKKIKKKSKKLKKKLKKEFGKSLQDDGIEDVFGERYFILGSIFFLGGLALAILGGIINVGLFGWLGGVGMVIGLVLIILAIIQVT